VVQKKGKVCPEERRENRQLWKNRCRYTKTISSESGECVSRFPWRRESRAKDSDVKEKWAILREKGDSLCQKYQKNMITQRI